MAHSLIDFSKGFNRATATEFMYLDEFLVYVNRTPQTKTDAPTQIFTYV